MSDLVLGFTRYDMTALLVSQPVVYACILAATALGTLIEIGVRRGRSARRRSRDRSSFSWSTNFASG